MAEEPEQMLEQDRVTTAFRREEGRAEVAVRQQHRDAAGKNRERQHEQERRHQHGPGKERHLVQRHARGAHVEDRGDEVDRAEDRRGAGNVQRQDREIHRRTRLARGRERRIIVQPPPTPLAPGGPSTNIEISSRPNAAGSSQNEMLFMRGKAMSGAPIMIGTNQLAKPPISAA